MLRGRGRRRGRRGSGRGQVCFRPSPFSPLYEGRRNSPYSHTHVKISYGLSKGFTILGAQQHRKGVHGHTNTPLYKRACVCVWILMYTSTKFMSEC